MKKFFYRICFERPVEFICNIEKVCYLSILNCNDLNLFLKFAERLAIDIAHVLSNYQTKTVFFSSKNYNVVSTAYNLIYVPVF